MIKQPLEDWQEEAKSRFGADPAKWAFKCPICGKVATIGDFLALGKDANLAAQECIGRANGTMKPFDGSDNSRGCDWAAYGLFGTIGRGRLIAFSDGHTCEVFEFANAKK